MSIILNRTIPIYWGDRSQILNDDIFENSDLVINQIHGFVACMACKIVLVSKNWATHLQNKHQTVKLISQESRRHINLQISNLIENQNGPLPAQGIPVFSGFECTECPVISQSIESHKTHSYSKHNGNVLFNKISFQKLLHGKKRVEIIVSLLIQILFFSFLLICLLILNQSFQFQENQLPLNPQVDVEEILKTFESQESGNIELNPHMVPPYLKFTGLISTLQIIPNEDVDWFKFPPNEKDHQESLIIEAAKQLWEECHSEITTNHFYRFLPLVHFLSFRWV